MLHGKSTLVPVLLLALIASACASKQPMGDAPRAAAPLGGERASQFCYPATAIDAELVLVDENKRMRSYAGSFASGLPLDQDPAPITFEFYEPAGVENPPVAIVLPILNGQKHIVRPFATYFAKHGFASIIVDSAQRTTLEDDILAPNAAIRGTIKRHRRMLDWVERRPGLDASRIVVFGASLGAFNALFLAATDDRVRAVVPALAAADLPYVFANSQERRIKGAFEEVMAEQDMSREELEASMRERLRLDTAELAQHLNSDRVMMVIARRDKKVPVAKQHELWALLGEPETVFLPTGHIQSAGYIFYLRKKSLEFFVRKLEDPYATTASISPASCLNTRNPSIMDGQTRRGDGNE